MTRTRLTLALLLTAGSAFAQDSNGDIRYTIKDDQAYSVTIRVTQRGAVTITQTKDNAKVAPGGGAKFAPIEEKIDAKQARVLMAAIRRGDQAIKSNPLPPTITGNFTLEWDGLSVSGNRSALGEAAQYRLALEELEGIRDRFLDRTSPQNTVLLKFGVVTRRYLSPFQSPLVTEISVYRDNQVFLVLPVAKDSEAAAQGVAQGAEGGANRVKGFMTHAERRRLDAAWGQGISAGPTPERVAGQMRVEFTFKANKEDRSPPLVLRGYVGSLGTQQPQLEEMSDVLDEIAARILAMKKTDEEADAQTTAPQGGIGTALQGAGGE